jgi:putative FmdB family regulatory protein
MPIYEYRCSSCGYTKDHLQKMADAPLTDCPECGQASYAKALTAPGFQLKGSGWYATDFKDKAKAAPACPVSTGEATGCGGCPAAGTH